MDADAFRKPASHSLPPPQALFAARARSGRVADLSVGGAAFFGPQDTPPHNSTVAVPFLWEEAPGKPIAAGDLQDDSGHAVPLKLPPRLQQVPASSSFAAGDSLLSSPRAVFHGPGGRRPPRWAISGGAALVRTASSGMGFLSRTWSKRTAAPGGHKNRGGDYERYAAGTDASWCSPASSSSSSSVSTWFGGDDHGHVARWRPADGRDVSSEEDDGSPRVSVKTTRFWKNRSLPGMTTSNLWASIRRSVKQITQYGARSSAATRYGHY